MKTKNLERCFGTFAIHERDIRDNPKLVLEILKGIIIVRCEMQYCGYNLVYHGISKKFREVPVGEVMPEYDVIVTKEINPKTQNKRYKIIFQEKKYKVQL